MRSRGEKFRLTQIGDFFVEMGEGGFKGLAMVGMSGGSEVVHDTDTGQLKVLALFFAYELFRSLGSRTRFLLRCFRSFDLRFDVLAFPATCHAYSVTQIVQIARDSDGKVTKEKSGAGGASLGENGKSRAHHTADGALRDTREMLGKDAAVGEFGGATGPGHSQAPGFFGLLRAGGSDFADGDLEERLETPDEHPNTFGADEELHGSRCRSSGLKAPAVDNHEGSQFVGLVAGVGSGFGRRQKNRADEHGQADDGRNKAGPQAERQDDQRRSGDSQENAKEHPRARVAPHMQNLRDN